MGRGAALGLPEKNRIREDPLLLFGFSRQSFQLSVGKPLGDMHGHALQLDACVALRGQDEDLGQYFGHGLICPSLPMHFHQPNTGRKTQIPGSIALTHQAGQTLTGLGVAAEPHQRVRQKIMPQPLGPSRGVRLAPPLQGQERLGVMPRLQQTLHQALPDHWQHANVKPFPGLPGQLLIDSGAFRKIPGLPGQLGATQLGLYAFLRPGNVRRRQGYLGETPRQQGQYHETQHHAGGS